MSYFYKALIFLLILLCPIICYQIAIETIQQNSYAKLAESEFQPPFADPAKSELYMILNSITNPIIDQWSMNNKENYIIMLNGIDEYDANENASSCIKYHQIEETAISPGILIPETTSAIIKKEIILEKPPVIIGKKIVNPYIPYTYIQMLEDANTLNALYSDLITIDTIGYSLEERNLLLIKLGKGKTKLFLCGSHHAREYISTTFLMRMIDEYAFAYANQKKLGNYNVNNLLDSVTLYIVPMVNPDGVSLVHKGLTSVKDQNSFLLIDMIYPTYREWKANINGVDLNKNYPAAWDTLKSQPVPSSEYYKGNFPASEPEIQAIMAFSNKHKFELAVSYHTKGEIIFWADIETHKAIPAASGIADRFCKLTGYRKTPISKDPATYGGGYENWFRLAFQRPAFCVELTPHNGSTLPHPDSQFNILVWNKAKYTGLFFAEEAIKLYKSSS